MIKSEQYPIIFPLISFIFGLYWQKNYAYSLDLILLSISVLFILLLYSFIKNFELRRLQILSCFILFFSAAFLLQIQVEKQSNLLDCLKNKNLKIVGKVESLEQESFGKTKESIKLHVLYYKYPKAYDYEKSNFYINLYIPKITYLKVGDYIKVKNIKLTDGYENASITGNPSYKDFLLKDNILASVFLNKVDYKLLYRFSNSLVEWFENKKRILYQELKTKIPEKTFVYFSTIFLGNKKEKGDSLFKSYFECWGILHYLARSGLHIVLFILLWSFLFRFLPVHIYFKKLLLLLVCIIYNFLSWTSISFVRAYYVFLFYESGKIFNQQVNFLHLLSFVCLSILLFNPIQLFFLDFQLSFALTFALAWPNSIKN